MNKTSVVSAALCIAAAVAVMLTVLVFNPMKDRNESLDGADLEAAQQRVDEQDTEIADLRAQVEKLRKENQGLRDTLVRGKGGGGMNPVPADGSGPGAHGKGAEAVAVQGETDAGEAGKAVPGKGESKLPWKELAADIMEIMKLAKTAGDKPTPELMKKYAALMGRIAEIQGKLGYADPGLVTSSPAFVANIIGQMLDQKGHGLSEAERASLDEVANRSQAAYHSAVKGPDTEFALEKTGRIVDAINAFEHDAFQVLGRDRFGGTELEKDVRDDGDVHETPWPEQSMAGVKDLDGAAESLTNRWMSRMGLPKSERPAIAAIAREYASRSRDAQSRVPVGQKGTLTNRQRHALDRELAGYQLEALKRISSLNLDEKTKKKVRGYNSLDRVDIGGKSTWSRSGGFGNMQFSSSSEETSSSDPKPERTD